MQQSCKHEPKATPENNDQYPEEVSKILNDKCAVSGCHNAASYANSGGILLDSWDHLFDGGNNGAAVIPYATDNSSLLYFINTDSSLGLRAYPVMPYNASDPLTGNPLSAAEYLVIKNWIMQGAPDKYGNIPFASNPDTRQKIYLTMQACDQVAVIDAAKRVVMRYISVGKTPAIESPHCVRVDKAGVYAYVSFLGGEYIQKIDTRTDSIVGEVYVGQGSWNVVHIADDGKMFMVSDWEDNGKVVLVNTETMTIEPDFGGNFKRPHGIASNSSFTVFYITSELENVIYKLNLTAGTLVKVPIDDGTSATAKVIHEIMLTPDESKYFITCQNSDEVRVMDANSDTLIKVISVGLQPQEIALSKSKHLMLVTCMEDNSSLTGFKGSVYAINYDTYETTRIDDQFYQPHGIIADDDNGVFYVASRNSNLNGLAPHHSSSCGGRNGYYTVFDLNTFQRLPKRYEVLPEPYSADIRFK